MGSATTLELVGVSPCDLPLERACTSPNVDDGLGVYFQYGFEAKKSYGQLIPNIDRSEKNWNFFNCDIVASGN